MNRILEAHGAFVGVFLAPSSWPAILSTFQPVFSCVFQEIMATNAHKSYSMLNKKLNDACIVAREVFPIHLQQKK